MGIDPEVAERNAQRLYELRAAPINGRRIPWDELDETVRHHWRWKSDALRRSAGPLLARTC